MTATISSLLDVDTLAGVATEVWSALVGVDEVLIPGDGLVSDGLSAWVRIDGPWTGIVLLTCSSAATDELTRAVLQLDPAEEPLPEDVDDVLRELVNILGGNVKSVLPGSSELGLPESGVPPRTGTDSTPVAVRWRGHPLTITVAGATEAPDSITMEVLQ